MLYAALRPSPFELNSPLGVADMDRIEILTRLALILRRMERLAGLESTSGEELHQTQDEVNRLREKWQDLTQELKRQDGSPSQSVANFHCQV
jgi:hypothetical protein